MKIAFKTILILFSILILIYLFCPYPIFHHGVLKNVDSLLYPNYSDKNLPRKLYITLDGVTGAFSKGSIAYTEMVSALQSSRSKEVVIAAGPYPQFERNYVGKITIPYWFIPFSFPLCRSSINTSYMWIGLPKRTTPGRTWPTIIDDGRLTRLVQENKISDNKKSNN